ncbi:MAG TPA: prolyl oligopeptidase family serine peptidase [Xanthobacteraceae bacterium]|nr:prolyl oligopeptidase family serine peptidase [Xanthobacteraceae bacterium]
MPTAARATAPYGSWKSPITSDLIVAEATMLSDVRIDGDYVYWLEGRPREQGRNVIVRAGPTGAATDITPAGFNARTRVHEYGGASWLVADGTCIFSNFADQRLYRQREGQSVPEPVTPECSNRERHWRYSDGVLDQPRRRWIGVREDHSAEGEPVNAIVAMDLDRLATSPGRVLAGGHDFFCSARLSPDANRMVWLAWDHPNMPWNGTTLYLADIDSGGTPQSVRVIAGGVAESVFQPEWSPDGDEIVFVSDRSGWWNLYAYNVVTEATRPLFPMMAEFGVPQWNLGVSTYAFADARRIVCTYTSAGLGQLATLDLITGTVQPIATGFTEFGSIRAERDRVVFRGGAPDRPTSVVTLDLRSGQFQILKQATDLLDRADLRIADYLARVEPVEFPTTSRKTAHGLFYPPHNSDYRANANELPPLLVKCHGGPTSAASSTLNLGTQFWTSRGIAVLDVNYGGSTGFGREYRERLKFNWGVVDVDDCVNGAKFLAERGLVDARRVVISGGSAGGYTSLAALAFRDFFQGGASYYGVSDAAALARDTHKFESRYLDWLIGRFPEMETRYRERSPLHHADRISKPVIFFQGADDAVVPPNQTEVMVEALRRNGNPVGYFLFSGEQHGFRQAANIKRCLDAEIAFYAVQVFRIGLTF